MTSVTNSLKVIKFELCQIISDSLYVWPFSSCANSSKIAATSFLRLPKLLLAIVSGLLELVQAQTKP